MKATALLLTSILLLAGCATTTDRIPGQYAVVVQPDSTGTYGFPLSQIVNALRERLGDVQVIDVPDAGSYDAVIVLKPHRPIRSHLASSHSTQPREVWKKEHGTLSEPGPRRADQWVQVVEFDIVRAGRNVGSGAARYEHMRSDDDMLPHSRTVSASTRRSLAAGIEVSREVVKALRSAG